MTLSPRVGGATSKPVDVSPSPVAQRFASNSCVTTKMTYEFFNELIENFTLAQASYAVTNVPNDPNALKKLLDSLRTGGYNFTVGTLGMGGLLTTNNNSIHIGTGTLSFAGLGNDYITYNDSTNEFSFFADSTIDNSILKAGNLNIDSLNVNTILEKTSNNGVLIDNVLIKDGTIRIPSMDIVSPESINIILDDNNNQTGQSFNVYNHDKTDANLRAKISETGSLSLFNPNGSNILNLVDGASTETLANIFLTWNYTTTNLQGTINRLGYIGYGSNLNTHLTIANEATGGDINIDAQSGIINVSNNGLTNASYINFGNEDLSLYRENVTFTATFYNGTTEITGSSGTSNVASYDARFSRIGNIVTVNISNIVWSVGGSCGTTLGSYPALTTTGEFSIRGLPYNALKDACGSIIGFYNGSGDVNVGSAYIISGTNNIRFSTSGFQQTFGIRGVTITYMV